MTDSPSITFVTVCKARLDHLRESLSAAAAQAPCVIVDYDCPQGSAVWVRASHPAVRVVKVEGEPGFNLARGRNLGAAEVGTEWIAFLDADVVPSRDLVPAIAPLLRRGRYLRPVPLTADTYGMLVVSHDDYLRCGGYDEAFQGWGGEDDDIYERLKAAGVAPFGFPTHLLRAIDHDDAERTRFHNIKDRELSRHINFAYLHIKSDLRRLTGCEPDDEIRKALYSEVHRVLSGALVAGGDARLELELPDQRWLAGWSAQRTLSYTIPAPIERAIRPVRRDAHGRPPVPFVVGSGRCGSTLLRLMLDSHPDLAIPDETHFIPNLVRAGQEHRELISLMTAEPRWPGYGLDPDALFEASRSLSLPPLEAVLRTFFESYAARFGKRRYGDKTPGYALHISLIRRVFPEARFIHLVRDPRDVAQSTRGKWWAIDDVASSASWWATTILSARDQGLGQDYYLEVRYEDLVSEPEPTLRRICAFIDLPWDRSMLEYYRRAGERLQEFQATPATDGSMASAERQREMHALTREPPQRSRIGTWRKELTREEVATVERLAGPLLAAFSYPRAE